MRSSLGRSSIKPSNPRRIKETGLLLKFNTASIPARSLILSKLNISPTIKCYLIRDIKTKNPELEKTRSFPVSHCLLQQTFCSCVQLWCGVSSYHHQLTLGGIRDGNTKTVLMYSYMQANPSTKPITQSIVKAYTLFSLVYIYLSARFLFCWGWEGVWRWESMYIRKRCIGFMFSLSSLPQKKRRVLLSSFDFFFLLVQVSIYAL